MVTNTLGVIVTLKLWLWHDTEQQQNYGKQTIYKIQDVKWRPETTHTEYLP